MKASEPLISVVIPTYNQAEFLNSCIKSVLAQSYPTVETVIINDGSTDNTREKLTAFHSHPDIRVFHQNNKGLSAARNAGLNEAKGSYIALLDSDDQMSPDRLKKQFHFLQEHSTVDIIYTAVTLIDQNGKTLCTMRRNSIPSENFLAEEFFRNQVPSPSTLMAKNEVFRKHPFDESLRFGEDLEWILRTAHHYTYHYLDEPLTDYRRHLTNISENIDQLREVELSILHSYGIDHICKCVEESQINDKPLLKGKILYIMEYFDEAIEHLNQSASSLALFYQGNCHFEQTNYQMAIYSYEKSLSVETENAACWNNLGVAFLKLGKAVRAKESFSKAAALKPGYLDPKQKKFTRRELRKDLLPYM